MSGYYCQCGHSKVRHSETGPCKECQRLGKWCEKFKSADKKHEGPMFCYAVQSREYHKSGE